MTPEPQHISNDERVRILSALYGELPAQERAAWEQLCAEKPHIADEYVRLRKTIEVLGEQEISDESAFFGVQWEMLESVMKSDAAAGVMPASIEIPKARIFALISPQMRRWYMAAATFLLTLGLGISVYTWQQSEERKRILATIVSDSVQTAPVLPSAPSVRGEIAQKEVLQKESSQKEPSQPPQERRSTLEKTAQPALEQAPQPSQDKTSSSEIKREPTPEAAKPEILNNAVKKDEAKNVDAEYESAPINDNLKAVPTLAPKTLPAPSLRRELDGLMKLQAAPSGRAMEERSLVLPQKRTVAATKATIRLDSAQMLRKDSLLQQREKK
jgi:hypothetical protein